MPDDFFALYSVLSINIIYVGLFYSISADGVLFIKIDKAILSTYNICI